MKTDSLLKSGIPAVGPFWTSVAEHIERSPAAWRSVADGLWHSAETLQLDSKRAYRTYRKLIRDGSAHLVDQTDPRYLAWRRAKLRYDQWRTASMLRAMAIEGYLKVLYYQRQIANGDRAASIKACRHHKLNELARECGLSLSRDQNTRLLRLQLMLQLGRYPVSAEGWTSYEAVPKDDADLRNLILSQHAQ